MIKLTLPCSVGSYCFPCISGVCPFGKDFMTDCYPRLPKKQKQLFELLFELRSKVVRRYAVINAFVR